MSLFGFLVEIYILWTRTAHCNENFSHTL